MSALMKQIKENAKRTTEKKENKDYVGNPDVYPFWNMEEGQNCKFRILLDPNYQNNPDLYFVSKMEHKLSINGEDRRIPCPSMHGHKCPICDLSRAYYKAAGKGNPSPEGKYYYRDKSMIIRAIITHDPLSTPENGVESSVGKVKILYLSYQASGALVQAIASDDMEDDFFDLDKGVDFMIVKSKSGEHFKYDAGSNFVRKSTVIPEAWRNFEPVNLETLLPEVPSSEEIHQLLAEHLGGEGADTQKAPQTTSVKDAVAGSTSVRDRLAGLGSDAPASPTKDVPTDDDDAGEDESEEDETEDAEIAAILNRRR